MFRAFSVVLLAFLLSARAAYSGGLETQPSAERHAGDRAQRLLEVLQSQKITSSYARALEETVATRELSGAHIQAMMDAMLGERRNKLVKLELSRAVSAGGKVALPYLLHELERRKPDEAWRNRGRPEHHVYDVFFEPFWYLVLSVGRMGKEAQEAIPLLKKKLKTRGISSEMEASIRVALLNLGDTSRKNMDFIIRHMKERTEAGKIAVLVMTWTGAAEWVDDRIIKELCERLGWGPGEYDEGVFAALALGVMGERAKSAAGALVTLIANADSAKDDFHIITFNAALARIEPSKRKAALRSMLKCIGHQGPRALGGTAVAMYHVAMSLIDEESKAEIVALLDDPDIEVVYGAVGMLGMLGFRAREAVPRLMKLLSTSADVMFSKAIAGALAVMADESYVPELEKQLDRIDREASENVREPLKWKDVRKDIKRAISVIRLEESMDD